MPAMTDPTAALESFQSALRRGLLNGQLHKGALDPGVCVHRDSPAGAESMRFTYVRLEGKTVTALVMLVPVDPLDGLPCFQVGVAVPPKYRKRGLAQSTMLAAIAELHAGMSRNGVPAFYVEAVVGVDNEASKRVAEKVLSSTPKQITDEVSGLPALHYAKHVGA